MILIEKEMIKFPGLTISPLEEGSCSRSSKIIQASLPLYSTIPTENVASYKTLLCINENQIWVTLSLLAI